MNQGWGTWGGGIPELAHVDAALRDQFVIVRQKVAPTHHLLSLLRLLTPSKGAGGIGSLYLWYGVVVFACVLVCVWSVSDSLPQQLSLAEPLCSDNVFQWA